ncbi:YvrJ family protein [Bacillus pinisoli]|uniref:YvrJ family protein n=1 Tax=Bacillus pinisoli TaxID=2901866 RepID=UPI001FF2DBFB|nr:YvrJ family protein [Bacillus pinisoli]
MEQLLPYISEVGFPIVVTLYLLHRIEAKLTTLNDSIQGLPAELREQLYMIK